MPRRIHLAYTQHGKKRKRLREWHRSGRPVRVIAKMMGVRSA